MDQAGLAEHTVTCCSSCLTLSCLFAPELNSVTLQSNVDFVQYMMSLHISKSFLLSIFTLLNSFEQFP